MNNKVRITLSLCAALAGLIVFFAPRNMALYDLALFPCPDPRTPDISKSLLELKSHNIYAQELVFPSKNGKLLHGIFYRVPGAKRVFLFSHGKGNNMYTQITKCRCLCACDASVFMYDYQGFGKSQGRASVQNACEDAIAAYDYLVDVQKCNPDNIIAFGQSFGSGVTGQLALHRKLAGAVIQSGFSSLISAARTTLPWLKLYPDWAFPEQMMDNIAAFNEKQIPLFITHGRTDKIISCNEAIKLFNSASQPKAILLFPDGHSTFGKGNTFAVALKKFISKNNI